MATTEIGAPGTVRGTPPAEGRDATAAPDTFDATTVNEYVTPLVRPVTVHDSSAVTHENPPGFEVTE